jgi:transcriptional regulator with XRE-family HTH domain
MSTRPLHAGAAPAATPGDHIRSVRKRLGLTLADLSQRTGLAVSTLSKLEKGNVSLSYDKLTLLSKGLDVDMAELLHATPRARQAQGGGGRRVIHRAGEGQLVETRSYRQLYLASELLNKRFTPLIAEIRARTLDEFMTEFGDFIRHPGEEFAYIIEGEVEVHTELYAPARLKAGDSIYFDSDMGHAYLKASDAPCRLVASCAGMGVEQGWIDAFIAAAEARQEPAPDLAQPIAASAARPAPKSATKTAAKAAPAPAAHKPGRRRPG